MAKSIKAIQADLDRIKEFHRKRRILDDAQIEDFEEQLKLACKYNRVMEHAPMELTELYYHAYIQGMPKSEINLYKWNISEKSFNRLFGKLRGYLRKWL